MPTRALKSLITFIAVLSPLACWADAPPDLREAFKKPPAEFRPLLIEHSGPLYRLDAARGAVERRAGGSVLDVGVTPGSKDLDGEPWNNPTYLNDPARFAKLREVVAAMKEAGLRVWIYDELGYPSASAGGRVLEGHPEFQSQVIRCRTISVPGGTAARISPEGETVVACFAMRRRDGVLDLEKRIDLTSQARRGAFDWLSPPMGDWCVCLIEQAPSETWRRHNIPRRNVNILDRQAVERFIELTHDRYAEALGDRLADVDLFFTDEPQLGADENWTGGLVDCAPMLPWCDELPTAFRKKYGYDLVDALPALFHDVGPRTAKYRHDFHDVLSDLVAENYFGRIQDWCRERGVASSGHMLLEESLPFHLMFSGSMLKNWARQDLPGVDQLGLPRYKTMGGWEGDSGLRVNEDFSVKMASSVDTLMAKRGVFSESYALSDRWKTADKARAAKGIAAWQYASGVTHMCTYSLQNAVSPEQYADFADFVGRLAVLRRRGRPVSDVAVLAPEAAVWATFTPPDGGRFQRYIACNPEPMRIDAAFRETCHQLLSHQRDVEVLGESLLAEADVNEGRLALGDQRFDFLILPEARMLSEASMRKIEAFAESGGRVIFVGSYPTMTPSRGVDASIRERAAELVAARADRVRYIDDIAHFSSVLDWMAEQVPPTIRWDGSPSVRIRHQHEPARDILLLANPSAEPVEGHLRMQLGGSVSIWNPETGAIEDLGERDPEAAVDITIPADSARCVVVERAP